MKKDFEYYEHERSEILGLIPASAVKVLDVGCAAGTLGKALKKRQECEVTGIEPSPEAAQSAMKRLDRVISEPVEKALEKLPDSYFDCIVLADVLEHLLNPAEVLKKIVEKLTGTGTIVISVPNFMHYLVIEKIINGSFRYDHEGILDNTHISFFSRDNFIKILTESRLKITSSGYVIAQAEKNELLLETLAQHSSTVEFMHHYDYFQYLFTVVKRERYNIAKSFTSIIITINGDFEDYMDCIESIIKNTALPYRFTFIIFDNNQRQKLENYKGSKIIFAKEKSASALNKALLEAKGEFNVIINQPVQIPLDWLNYLIEKTVIFENTGIVGPKLNQGLELQMAGTDGYKPGNSGGFEKFAASVNEQYRGLVIENNLIDNSCFLITGNLIEAIGGFDPVFSLNTFELADYCTRAVKKGFHLLIAKDVFCYKTGTGKVSEELFEVNRQKYNQKWEKMDTPLYIQPDKLSAKEKLLKAVKNPEELEKLKQEFENSSENTEIMYLSAYLDIMDRLYPKAMEKLQKLLKKDKINQDICQMFAYVLNKLGNEQLSKEFELKVNNLENVSVIHEILEAYPLEK